MGTTLKHLTILEHICMAQRCFKCFRGEVCLYPSGNLKCVNGSKKWNTSIVSKTFQKVSGTNVHAY